MTPAARIRARRGEGPLLRDEILAAAEALLVETASEEAVSIRAIADRVGVTAPSIYRHFADKDALLFAVCERTFARLDSAMEAAAAGHTDPFDALLARGTEYVRFGMDHPEHYRVLFMTLHDDKEVVLDGDHLVGEVVEGSRAFNNLVDAAARIIGTHREPGALELACEIWAFVHGLTALHIAHPTMPWPPVETNLAGYVAGLRARFA